MSTIHGTGLTRCRPCFGMLAGAVLTACGTEQLPVGAVLTVSPESQTIDVVVRRDEANRCLLDPAAHVDLPLVLALRDAQGAPIGDAELAVYVDFAANTYSGFPALALFDDLNGNGVVDAEAELISGADDSIARVRTDRFGGDRLLLLRVNLSCDYSGTVFAVSGATTASASIRVVDTSEVPSPGDGAEEGE